VIERARNEPETLVIGVDASAAAMAEASRRAARAARRGGLPNALFVVAGAEHPPDELVGLADEVTIQFPWGSLLAGALAFDPAAAAGIASLVAAEGHVRILASVVGEDRLAMSPLDGADAAILALRWSRHGLRLCSFRPATAAEVDASGSSWARRLAAGRRRPTWRIELVKTSCPEASGQRQAGSVDDEPQCAR
jgi:16S rRNA (adenine(1408)-N(1))-methyltransferase